MNRDSNINLNIPLIYVSPVGEKDEQGLQNVATDKDFNNSIKNINPESLFHSKTANNKRPLSTAEKRKNKDESRVVDDLLGFNEYDTLKSFNSSYVNDIYLNDANRLYPTNSNQSNITSFSNENVNSNFKNSVLNENNLNYNSTTGASNNNQTSMRFLGDDIGEATYDEDEDDEIQSFYSAFGDVLVSPEEKVENGKLSGSGNLNHMDDDNSKNDSLHTSFLLPDIQKIKSNSNGFLAVNRVNSREERSNSVSKKSGSRSRSRSRSRSHSVLSNAEETKLLKDLDQNSSLHGQETAGSHNNKSNFLQVSKDDVDSFSQVSEAEMKELLKDLKDFDPLTENIKEETIVPCIYPDASLLSTENDFQEKQFVCDYCSFAFLRKHDLKRHTAKHLNLKNYCCKGFLMGSLPIEAEIFLLNINKGSNSYGALSLKELTALLKAVEDFSNSQYWGCDREFLRSDALNRHLKTKMGKECLKLAYEDFKNGNVYKTYKFLKMKELLDSLSNGRNTLSQAAAKENEPMRDKFIECELILKDMNMNILETINWPMESDLFENVYIDTYEKNLQKVIQRRVKLKKKQEKEMR